MFARPIAAAAALLSLASAAPGTANAQDSERHLSILAGGFTYDFGGDATSPAAAVRVDTRLSRHLIGEVGFSYSSVPVTIVNNAEPDPTSREARSNIMALTAGVQAELPLSFARPFVGIAAGIFGRFDPKGGDRFVLSTMAFPVGVRVPVTERVGARAEARIRFDDHQGGTTAADSELLVGLTWRF
jgi:hypothetical protein